MVKHVDAASVKIYDLQKAQTCKCQNTPMCNPKECELCAIQSVFCDDNKARKLCELMKDDLLTLACRKQEIAEAENKRLRTIIVKHMRADELCTYCKNFEQCKRESEIEDNYAEQTETLFWNCYDGRYFDPKDE